MECMTPQQRASVYSIGFGALFDFKIVEIPGRIGWWCLTNFEPKTCCIIMRHGSKLRITEHDVWLTLGLPNGSLEVGHKSGKSVSDLRVEWLNNMKKKKVRRKDVYEAVVNDKDGGVWFCRNLMILLEMCLFENAADGSVSPKIIDSLSDINKIKEMNWCGHVIKLLGNHQIQWMKNTKTKFTGPILFLIVSVNVLFF